MPFRFCHRVTWLLTPAMLLLSGPRTLRDAASSSGILIGTAVRPSSFSEAAYSATLGREFNMIEAEDAMKWPVIRSEVDKLDFRQGDEVVRFAEAHRMKVRGH